MRDLPLRRSFLANGLLTGLAMTARSLRAQDESPDASPPPTFSTDVRVVNVLATVRTKGGEIVADLTQDDFLLSEDNRPQTVKFFSREMNLPLILGLLVDTSASQHAILAEEKLASFRFLDQILRENIDKTFLVHFDFEAELLQSLTSSKQSLRRGLDKIGTPVAILAAAEAGATTLYDAVDLASAEIMRGLEGRKALLLLTDGVDRGSHFALDEAIEAAQRANTLIYSILFEGDEGGPAAARLEAEGAQVLRKMSQETGGGFFQVSRKLGIDAIYSHIGDELRSQYSIGYTPDRLPDSGAFRAIGLKVRRKDLVVQCRQGYYPLRN